tara:strand:- start:27599 stop:29377 length:1779 start_codon:yes stop_codon:yes gene_type:complete
MVKIHYYLSVIFLFFYYPAIANEQGFLVYQKHCADCHQDARLRAPSLGAIKKMSENGIRQALTMGVMKEHSRNIDNVDFDKLLLFLSSQTNNTTETQINECSEPFPTQSEILWSNWGNGLSNQRVQAKSSLNPQNISQLELKWAFGFNDSIRIRSQPLVTEDTIYIGSQSGHVYALSLDTGCQWWSFKADAEVRGAITLSDNKKSILFTDFAANVYRLNSLNGEIEWKKNVATHPLTTITGSIAVTQDSVFIPLSSTEVVSAIDPNYMCCTFRGGLIALNTSNGDERWKMHTVPEPKKTGYNSNRISSWGPSGAPVWSTPTIDLERGLIYIGVGQNYSHPATELSDAIIAIGIESGRVVWHKQTLSGDVWNAACVTNRINCPGEYGPDYDIGASIILIEGDKDMLIAGQKSGMVFAMDPDDNGSIIWQKRVGRGGKKGGVHWGMTIDDDSIFVPIADLPEKIPSQYSPMPGIHALRIKDGSKEWYRPALPVCEDEKYHCYPSVSAAPSRVGSMIITGSMNGIIEIISTKDGNLLWSFDTAMQFKTINQISANGGSIDSNGPIIAGNHLIATSGYDIYGQLTGNILLVFSIED